MTKVSIIIPTYNNEQTILKCIKSLLQIELPYEIEIIVIDDGSTDHTKEQIREVIDLEYIKVVEQKNSGVSSARNRALDIITGEYVLMVDSDDWVESDYIETMVSTIDNSNVDSVICGYYIDFFETQESVIVELDVPKEPLKEQVRYVERRKNLNLLWNKIYKKSIIEQYQIRFNEDLTRGEDLDFNIQYFKHVTQISSVSRPLYHYVRRNTASLLQKYTPKMFDQQWVIFNNKVGFFDYYNMNSDEDVRLLNSHFFNMINNCIKNEFRIKSSFKQRNNNIAQVLKTDGIKSRLSDKTLFLGPNKLIAWLCFHRYALVLTLLYSFLFGIKRLFKKRFYKWRLKSAKSIS